MRAEYVKEWTETYLQVLPEKQNTENYIEHMLKHQLGSGRLECSKELQDGCECYRYKVSGKKALSAVYAAIPMKEAQIRDLLLQLIAAFEDAKECLLLGEDFVLEPSYMFVSLPQLSLGLCYVPGYGKELSRQLEGLFEYMLNRVDYEDKPAVKLLYDCYTICMKDKEGLEALKNRLEKKEDFFFEPAKPQESFVKEASVSYTGTSLRGPDKLEQKTYVSWMKEKISMLRRKKKSVITQLSEEKQKEETDREVEDSRTVLLAVREPKDCPQLTHEQTGEVIALDKFPFYLGREKEYASCAVEREGISRLHFCIQKRGGQYYLSDLNSTNGTYLNGTELLPGTEQKLVSQDTIRIGTEEFVFSFE